MKPPLPPLLPVRRAPLILLLLLSAALRLSAQPALYTSTDFIIKWGLVFEKPVKQTEWRPAPAYTAVPFRRAPFRPATIYPDGHLLKYKLPDEEEMSFSDILGLLLIIPSAVVESKMTEQYFRE